MAYGGLEPALRPARAGPGQGPPDQRGQRGWNSGGREGGVRRLPGKAKKYDTAAWPLIHRVKRLNDAHVPFGQGELFTVWRFHAVFTDSHLELLVETERCH
ncbi:hypothetical protein GCM10023079_06270 [Streptomyces chitinivorans]